MTIKILFLTSVGSSWSCWLLTGLTGQPETQGGFMRIKWFRNFSIMKNCAHTVSFSGLNLGMWIQIWLSWKADWNMNLILSKTFFSSEVRTLKLRSSVGSQSLSFDGSSENILSEQVTNCPSGDKGLITHTAYRGPRPKWTGLSQTDGLCGYRSSQGLQAHRGKPSLGCLICKWNILKSGTRRAGRMANALAFLEIWFLQLCSYLSEQFRKPVSEHVLNNYICSK